MTVTVIGHSHPSVVKQKICYHCGAVLEYVPKDVKERVETDYTGGRDVVRYIDCPACNHSLNIR